MKEKLWWVYFESCPVYADTKEEAEMKVQKDIESFANIDDIYPDEENNK